MRRDFHWTRSNAVSKNRINGLTPAVFRNCGATRFSKDAVIRGLWTPHKKADYCGFSIPATNLTLCLPSILTLTLYLLSILTLILYLFSILALILYLLSILALTLYLLSMLTLTLYLLSILTCNHIPVPLF